ncbi:MAG TPA: hypothetical protein EYN86_04650 [Planctomycetes bacterium]|nr:hypothetical protein [Planctomycetota bacterium]
MFKRKKNKSKPDRLLVYTASRKSQKRELPQGTLNDVLDQVFARHPQSAQSLWTISALLTTNLLKDIVFSDFDGVKNIYLRPAPQHDYALEIQVDIVAGTAGEFADAAYQELVGSENINVESVEKTEPIQPIAVPSPPDDSIDDDVEVKTTDNVEVEFVPPPTRQQSQGRKWQQRDDDIFGLAGEAHPDDKLDHGLELGPEDLPWLNPGDTLISPRRGPCRVKKVDDEQRQLLVHDESKNMLMISFDELLAEFEFDDE